MIYKIILSNSKNEIQINSDEELSKIVRCIQRGDKVVICKNGVFNPSYVVGIFEDRETEDGVFGNLRTPGEREKKQAELAAQPSTFAKALAGNQYNSFDVVDNKLLS